MKIVLAFCPTHKSAATTRIKLVNRKQTDKQNTIIIPGNSTGMIITQKHREGRFELIVPQKKKGF